MLAGSGLVPALRRKKEKRGDRKFGGKEKRNGSVITVVC